MVAVAPILSLLIIFALSLLVVRIGSVALQMTGLSADVASFQATSAFTGAGYTTEEAERTVSTAARRRTVKALIRLGSIGLAGSISSLVLSFAGGGTGNALGLAYVVGGAGVIILVAQSRWFNRLTRPLIERALSRTTTLNVADYAHLLGLQSEYSVAEVDVGTDDWLADKTLAELDLPTEGVLVLGIRRDGSYVGAPQPETETRPGDTLVLYGKRDRLQELAGREVGDTQAREDAVDAHEAVLSEEEQLI